MRNTIFAFLYSILLTQTLYVRAEAGGVDPSTAAVRLSAQKGLTWLMDHPSWIKTDPSLIYSLQDINEKYCHDPKIDGFIRDNIKEISRNPANSGLRRLVDKNTDRAYSKEILNDQWEKLPETIGKWNLMALYCDVQPMPKATEAHIFDISTSTGYMLALHFQAMTLMEKVGCKDRKKDAAFRTAYNETAKKMAEERYSPEEFDLYAERTAYLQAAGYPELIKEEWIRDIVSMQDPSGGWPYSGAGPKTEKIAAHPTALAAWALVLYQKECPVR